MTTPTITRSATVTPTGIGPVDVVFDEAGEGHPILLLHGGGGPATVTGFAERFAAERSVHARVITPTHPGFNGRPRPAALSSIPDLARLYTELLEQLQLRDVTVVGNSIGGWIAAEMAIIGSARVSSYVIVDAVGIEVDGHPVVDFFSLSPEEIAQHSYHDPVRYGIDPTTLPPAAQEAMAANRATLSVFGGTRMTDPGLADRLATVSTPTLVIWGEADRIADVDYGRSYAEAIPGAEFRLFTESGHLPQIETPEKLMSAIWEFADRHATDRPGA